MALLCGIFLALAVSDVNGLLNGKHFKPTLITRSSNSAISSQRILVQNRIPTHLSASTIKLSEVGNDIVILPSETGSRYYLQDESQQRQIYLYGPKICENFTKTPINARNCQNCNEVWRLKLGHTRESHIRREVSSKTAVICDI